MEDEIINFLNLYDYDIRKTNDARWIDQKCTMDVLSVVSDCIIEYIQDEYETKEFTVRDIWYSDYTKENVMSIFCKPNPMTQARNEYDKWFGQQLKLLGYSKVLIERKEGRNNVYKVNNIKILRYIASRDLFAHKFLVSYITKVLKDSDIYNYFENFFEFQNQQSYNELKDTFANFIIENTNINGKTECNRIFIKVLNPLAFERKKKGTIKGHISSNIITLDSLMYNRPNWRDISSKKPKDITREEYNEMYCMMSCDEMSIYKIQKAKKELKKYNMEFRNGMSEVDNGIDVKDLATHMHHIFTQAEYPTIAAYIENLIALTPTQHLNYAHVNGNTQVINKDFQRICLICKIGNIKENIMNTGLPTIYDFNDLCFVLNTGFSTDIFDKIKYLDFTTVLEHVEFMY